MAVSTAPQQALSPELVLVDPALAADARSRLPGPGDAIAQLESESGPQRGQQTEMTSSRAARRTAAASAEQTALALQRLDQLAEMDERLRRRRPRFRVAKLTAALATWATVAILVADTQLWTSLPV